jgi:hypothetical protein
MGRSLFVALLLAAWPPDGELVLGVAGHDEKLDAVTREWAAVADPRTGSVRERRLAGGTLCGGPVLAVGDRVIFSSYRGRRAVVRALPMSLAGGPRTVGRADVAVPSPGEPTLWLGRWRRHDRRFVLWLREVDAGGEVLVRTRALLPRMGPLHAALKWGFVVTSGRWLSVWDQFRDGPRRIARDGWFVAASESRVAWCGGDCPRIHVWREQGSRTLAPPAGTRLLGSSGAFSPDGRLLATGVTVRGRKRLALVDPRSGEWTLVPDGKLGGYDAIAWSPSGDWVYFTDGDEGLRAWRRGAPSAVKLPIDAGGTVMSIATASATFAGFSPL